MPHHSFVSGSDYQKIINKWLPFLVHYRSAAILVVHCSTSDLLFDYLPSGTHSYTATDRLTGPHSSGFSNPTLLPLIFRFIFFLSSSIACPPQCWAATCSWPHRLNSICAFFGSSLCLLLLLPLLLRHLLRRRLVCQIRSQHNPSDIRVTLGECTLVCRFPSSLRVVHVLCLRHLFRPIPIFINRLGHVLGRSFSSSCCPALRICLTEAFAVSSHTLITFLPHPASFKPFFVWHLTLGSVRRHFITIHTLVTTLNAFWHHYLEGSREGRCAVHNLNLPALLFCTISCPKLVAHCWHGHSTLIQILNQIVLASFLFFAYSSPDITFCPPNRGHIVTLFNFLTRFFWPNHFVARWPFYEQISNSY